MLTTSRMPPLKLSFQSTIHPKLNLATPIYQDLSKTLLPHQYYIQDNFVLASKESDSGSTIQFKGTSSSVNQSQTLAEPITSTAYDKAPSTHLNNDIQMQQNQAEVEDQTVEIRLLEALGTQSEERNTSSLRTKRKGNPLTAEFPNKKVNVNIKQLQDEELKAMIRWCQKNPEGPISRSIPTKITDTLSVSGKQLYDFRKNWQAGGQLSPDAFIIAKQSKKQPEKTTNSNKTQLQLTDEELKAMVRWCQANLKTPLSTKQLIQITDTLPIPSEKVYTFRERWKGGGQLDPEAFILAKQNKRKPRRTNEELKAMVRWCQQNLETPISQNKPIKITSTLSVPGNTLYGFRNQWKASGQLDPDTFTLAKQSKQKLQRPYGDSELKALVHWCQINPEISINQTRPVEITNTLSVPGVTLYNFRERWKASGQPDPNSFILSRNRKTPRTAEELKALVNWCQQNPETAISHNQLTKINDNFSIHGHLLYAFRERWKISRKLDPESLQNVRTAEELKALVNWCQKNPETSISHNQLIKINDDFSIPGSGVTQGQLNC